MRFKLPNNVRVVVVVLMALLVPIADAGADTTLDRSDNAVKGDIEKALDADRSLDDSRIIVKSVSGGDVILGGSATSVADIIRALQLTASRRGVRRVFSDIEGDAGCRPTSGRTT